MKPDNRQPNFQNLLDVLHKKTPSRPTLFEFFLNERLERNIIGEEKYKAMGEYERMVQSFYLAGFDYATIPITKQRIVPEDAPREQTISLNAGHFIHDRQSFEAFTWPNPDEGDMAEFATVGAMLPEGMKVIIYGPGGVLENTIALVGYENLCMMLYDDPDLAKDIFDKVGSTLLRMYEIAIQYGFVGALIANDDWGYNTQTMLSPADLRRYVFPWHKRIVALAHSKGCPAILHSCGYYGDIIEDIIMDMSFDARHSYEDNIIPVERAYEQLKGRIAVLGGIDVDFMVTASEDAIYQRAKSLVEMGNGGGYALGTGNSIAPYIPDAHYFAMTRAVLEI